MLGLLCWEPSGRPKRLSRAWTLAASSEVAPAQQDNISKTSDEGWPGCKCNARHSPGFRRWNLSRAHVYLGSSVEIESLQECLMLPLNMLYMLCHMGLLRPTNTACVWLQLHLHVRCSRQGCTGGMPTPCETASFHSWSLDKYDACTIKFAWQCDSHQKGVMPSSASSALDESSSSGQRGNANVSILFAHGGDVTVACSI